MSVRNIYILLPVHNRAEKTVRFVETLLIQTYQKFKLILIDDGSSDSTQERVANLLPREKLICLHGDGTLWWAGSLQLGVNYLRAQAILDTDIVLIINDDLALPVNFLSALLECTAENSILVAMAAFKEHAKKLDVRVFADWKNFVFKNVSKSEDSNCAPTRGVSIIWSDFKEIGDFYPRLLPHYGSDYEFTMRAVQKGFKIVTHPSFYLYSEDYRETNIKNQSVGFEYIRHYFSKKNQCNPRVMLILVFLSCPLRYKVINFMRVLKNCVYIILKHVCLQCTKWLNIPMLSNK